MCEQGITQMEGEEKLEQTVLICLKQKVKLWKENMVKRNQLLFKKVSCLNRIAVVFCYSNTTKERVITFEYLHFMR